MELIPLGPNSELEQWDSLDRGHGASRAGLGAPRMDLIMYDGKRIAVVFRRAETLQVFRCTAAFQQDEDLGPVLRIPLNDKGNPLPGNPVFIIEEDTSSDYLVEDDRYGCDFRFEVGSADNSDKACCTA